MVRRLLGVVNHTIERPMCKLADSDLRVLTVSTLFPSDWVVHRPDWLGLLMFSGVPCVSGAWNAVRVPPWARVSAGQGAFGPLAVHKSSFMGPFGGPFGRGRLWALALPFLGMGEGSVFLLVHGGLDKGLHDF